MPSKGRLLLIDDEAALLRLMQTYLTRLGYEVAACSEASAAFETARTDQEVELAIVDLSLIDGRSSLMSLAEANTKMRILICSGSPFEIETLPAQLHGRFAFLQKPFLPNMLAEAVDELLRRESGPRSSR